MTQVNTSMNFLPEDYVEKRQAARAAVVFIGLLLVVVGGIVGAYMYTQWTMKGVFDAQDRVNSQFEDASKQIENANELETQKARMVAKAEITTTLMERVHRSALLHELTRLLPPKVSFVSLELKSKDIAPSANAPRPNSDLDKARAGAGLPTVKPPSVEVTLDLIATAPTDSEVASYMSALKASPLLTDLNLLFSEEYHHGTEDKAETMRRFHVVMKINPDADLRGSTTVANVVKPEH